MNINDLQYNLQKYQKELNEICIIGKTAEIDGMILHVIGISRYENKLKLLVLQYNEEYAEKIEQSEIDVECGFNKRADTNREEQNGNKNIDYSYYFKSIYKAIVGGNEFKIKSSSISSCDSTDLEYIAMFSVLLQKGWDPKGIENCNLDRLFCSEYKIDGDCPAMPDFGSNPRIDLSIDPNNITGRVEQPIELVIDGEYKEKIWFYNEFTNQNQWVQINSVQLYDMWAEQEKIFSHPKILARFSQSELEEFKLDAEKNLLEDCPRGMYYVIIEYECEEDMSLQFHSTSWLDAKPVNKNMVMYIMVKPDKKTGICGSKLQVIVISDQPLPSDTKKINVELSSWNKTITNDDIVIV